MSLEKDEVLEVTKGKMCLLSGTALFPAASSENHIMFVPILFKCNWKADDTL